MGVKINLDYGYYENDTSEEKKTGLIAKFSYDDSNDSFLMYDMFKSEFIPKYGQLSKFAKENDDFLKPYQVNKNGEFTTENTKIIGGTNIPAGAILPIITSLSKYPKIEIFVGNNRIMPDTHRLLIMKMLYELKEEKNIEEAPTTTKNI